MSPSQNLVHQNELFKFIKILHDEQKKAWSSENPNFPKFGHCIQALERSNWIKLEDTDITKLEKIWTLNKKIDFDTVGTYGNRVLFLPPLEKESGFFVIMWFKCELDPYFSNIRVMLIKKKSDEELAERPSTNLYWAIGFRIETGSGMHRYHHAQLINDFKGSEHATKFFDSIPWLPVTQPAFPLYAIDPLTVIVSLYITLYGIDQFRNILINHGSQLKQFLQSPDIKKFLDVMSIMQESSTKVKRARR